MWGVWDGVALGEGRGKCVLLKGRKEDHTDVCTRTCTVRRRGPLPGKQGYSTLFVRTTFRRDNWLLLHGFFYILATRNFSNIRYILE